MFYEGSTKESVFLAFLDRRWFPYCDPVTILSVKTEHRQRSGSPDRRRLGAEIAMTDPLGIATAVLRRQGKAVGYW